MERRTKDRGTAAKIASSGINMTNAKGNLSDGLLTDKGLESRHKLVAKHSLLTKRAKAVFRASSADRVFMIRKGVPAVEVVEIGRGMLVTKERMYNILDLPRATVDRKIKKGEVLSPEQSERVIGLERLIGQVAVMVAESGNAAGFDAGQWVGEWLECPLPALGGMKPAEFMDTMEGQELVSRLIAQSQSGTYG